MDSATVETMRKQRAEGLTLAQIAQLHDCNEKTVSRALADFPFARVPRTGHYAATVPLDLSCDYDDLVLVDCAGCGCELAPAHQTHLLARLRDLHLGLPLPRLLGGRVGGRPYCRACLRQSGREG